MERAVVTRRRRRPGRRKRFAFDPSPAEVSHNSEATRDAKDAKAATRKNRPCSETAAQAKARGVAGEETPSVVAGVFRDLLLTSYWLLRLEGVLVHLVPVCVYVYVWIYACVCVCVCVCVPIS